MRETVIGDVLKALVGALAAVFVYSLAGAGAPGLLIVFNAFSVVVLYIAVRRGEMMGALAGMMCGLAQDAFSLNVFGVAGLTKTLLGFWTGSVSRRIDVAPAARNALFLLVMSVLEMLLWVALTALVRWRAVNLEGGLLFVQPLVTAALAGGLLAAERRLERRKSRGA